MKSSVQHRTSLTFSAAALVTALALGLACGTDDSPPEETTLAPGKDVERPLAGDETHTYRLEVPAGFFLALEADSWDVDLVATLHDPGGRPLGSLESPASRWGPELLLALADEGGQYRLEVRGGPGSSAGRYELAVAELREAVDADRPRFAAWKLHSEGLVWSEKDGSEADEKALEKFQQALEPWRQAADRRGEAATLHWIGRRQKDLSRLQEAEESYLAALELRRELDLDAEAETLYRLGTLYRDQGRYTSALERFREALPLWRRLGDRHRQASTLYNQGAVYRRLAAMQPALERYGEALALYRDLGNRKMEARTLGAVAVVRQLLGESDKAVAAFRDVLPIFEELGDLAAQASTLNNLGWVHLKVRQEPGLAVGYFEECLRLAAELEDLRLQVDVLGNLSQAQIELGDPRTALRQAEQARDLSRRLQDPDRETDQLINVGLARAALEETAAAARRFEEALALSRKLGNRSQQARALYHLARLRRTAGRPERAVETLRQALAILEAVRTDVDSRSLKSTFLAFRRPYYELEVDLLAELARRHPDAGYEGRALAAAERARARGLLEILAEMGSDLRTGADPALLAEEQDLRRKINQEELRRWRDAEEEQPAGIHKRLASLLEQLEDVEQRIREDNPRYADLTRPQPLGLDEIQRDVLDGESLLLEYSLGEERSYLFAVTASSASVFELPSRREIEEAGQEVYDLLTDRFEWLGPDWREHVARFERSAAALGEILLGPVARQLEGRRLVIAAEGVLLVVPFAALPAPAGSPGEGEPLVAGHEIVSIPSASSLAVLRRQLAGRRRAPRTLAVVADPVFDPRDPRLTARPDEAGRSAAEDALRQPLVRSARETGLGQLRRLPHSRREAESISALVEPDQRYLALAFAASRDLATGPELGRYRILHFATHGLMNDRTPELSGLVLSLVDEAGRPRDGFLRLHDIYNLELRAELVVLSACQTALGKSVRGEGLIGLVRGFHYAGSERVIASLWQIEDEATAPFMQRFYRGLLQDGLSPAAALRRAQLEMLRGEVDPGWRQPYFWAAFILQGEWRGGWS